MNPAFDPLEAARRLAGVWNGDALVASSSVCAPTREQAIHVQDETVRLLGAGRAWKIGAKTPDAQPHAAPLPARGLVQSGQIPENHSPARRKLVLRGVEVEVGVRLARDLPGDAATDRASLVNAVDCVLPIIEIVETRLVDWREASPLALLGDLQSHGALVMGAPSSFAVNDIDLRTVEAALHFDGQAVAHTRGGNPAGDLWRLLAWLVPHAASRGRPLRAGDVVTTGSCTGMLFAGPGAHVVAGLTAIGRVETHL